MLVYAIVTAMSFGPLRTIRTCFVLDPLTQAIVVNKVITNHATDMPILHVEASFISAERGLRREILSRTSLKHCIHFSFILKLAIFIHKQLKRPVAFSAVHAKLFPLPPSTLWWWCNNMLLLLIVAFSSSLYLTHLLCYNCGTWAWIGQHFEWSLCASDDLDPWDSLFLSFCSALIFVWLLECWYQYQQRMIGCKLLMLLAICTTAVVLQCQKRG